MKIVFLFLILLLSGLAQDFTKKKNVQDFIQKMHQEHGFSKTKLNQLFKNVLIQKDSLRFYTKPVRTDYKKYTWDAYSKNFLKKKKVDDGVSFLKKYNKELHQAFVVYNIPGEYIVAIIGIESNYGGFMGNHPVFDTLSTLAFVKNRRNKFFTKELIAYLKMTKKYNVPVKEIKGSFAGAIGYGQFMPSNFKRVGVDFDKDGTLRLDKPVDAIGSVASYFNRSGWKKGIPVATRVSYKGKRFTKYKTGYKTAYKRTALKGVKPKKPFYYKGQVRLIKLRKNKYDELWYGTSNFKVITTYNHSGYYAMSVHQLAQKIKKAYLKTK